MLCKEVVRGRMVEGRDGPLLLVRPFDTGHGIVAWETSEISDAKSDLYR